MSISDLFIRRPVMTTLISLAIVAFGAMAYRYLPVSDLPNVDFPVIVVEAQLPGASPETMASSVALPLEKQFSTIAGITSMTSTSIQGSTSVSLQFDLNRSIDAAAQDVQAAIAQANAELPQGMPTPPTYTKVNPADKAILYLGLSSSTLPLSTVDTYAETELAERISMITGVAQVQVYGAQKYAVRVQIDPRELAAHGIGIDEVSQAVQAGNVDLPTGTLYGSHQAFTVRANGQLFNAASYRPLIVTYKNGSPVRLGELGDVIDSVENDKVAGWINGQRGIVLGIERQPGTNTVEVIDNIRKILPAFRADLPAAITLTSLYDRSDTIRSSVDDVQFTLMVTVCLVVMVIFLFLRNLSATIIPSLALPMSLVGTFAVMWLLGYTLDNLSLLALTLSVGFVVDDAIVMLENIVRHMEMGKGVLQASYDGSHEIGFTILSMTFSLAAVFIPVLFLGGVLGRLLHEFAVTIAAAILVSGFVSLTLTPMLCSRFLRPPQSQLHGRLYNVTEGGFHALLERYRVSLNFVMRHRRATMFGLLLLVAGTGYLAIAVQKGFIPSEDTGQILVFTKASQGISFDAMVNHQKALADILGKDPDVANYFSSCGSEGNFGAPNSGVLFAHLKPLSQRKLSADQLIAKLRPQLSAVPGILAFVQNPPLIQMTAQFTNALYQMTLQSTNTEQLYRYAPILEDKMRAMKSLRDVDSDLQIHNPQVNVTINRDKAHALGVSAQAIEDALYNAYGSREISTIYASNEEYKVILEVEPRFQGNPETLSMLYVRSSSGKLVPLATVAKLERTLGPLAVNHTGQLPSVTISFNVAPGVSLGGALDQVKQLANNTLPDNITASYQGTAQAFESSLGNLGMLLILAILVIYLVLGILYESFIHPITILSGLPAAGFGALLTLMLFGLPLDLFSFVGVIMLVGLVKKNAIMMIDFAIDAQRTENVDAATAIVEGCLIRFRPIMMTTMAALLGVLPIAIGSGPGADARRGLGLAVVGGLFFSQLLTLYITPVVYTYMDRVHQWLAMRHPEAHQMAPAGAPLRGDERMVHGGRRSAAS
ncbi:MAG: efflux RND transporter permease subunit [Candidatus Binataceae bacterium]|nr:efflux RND transporter permease subunit [Candidatus Binataceae bacterium]